MDHRAGRGRDGDVLVRLSARRRRAATDRTLRTLDSTGSTSATRRAFYHDNFVDLIGQPVGVSLRFPSSRTRCRARSWRRLVRSGPSLRERDADASAAPRARRGSPSGPGRRRDRSAVRRRRTSCAAVAAGRGPMSNRIGSSNAVGVEVGRGVPHHDLVAGGDRRARPARCRRRPCGACAAPASTTAGPPRRLGRAATGSATETLPLIGVGGERHRPVGQRRAGGLVAGEHEHVEQVAVLRAAEALAVVARRARDGSRRRRAAAARRCSPICSPYSYRAWLAALPNGSRRSGVVLPYASAAKRRPVTGAFDQVVRELDQDSRSPPTGTPRIDRITRIGNGAATTLTQSPPPAAT